MKQTTKTLVALLALLLVAGGIAGVALWAGKDEQKKAEAKEKSEKLFDFDKAHARELRLSKDGHPVARLVKSEKSWKLVQPVEAEADDTAVDSLLSSLSGLKQKKDLPDEKDLKSFGLDQPKATVKLAAAAGSDTYARVLRIGQVKSGAAQKTYAKREDSPTVYEVDKQILTDVEKEPFDLQNKELVKVDREAVRKLVFQTPAGKVEITRVKNAPPDGGFPDEVFTVVAPLQGAAKKWKISSALYSIASLRAAAFEGPVPAAKDLAKYGLDKPKTVTLLGDEDKVLARVRVGSEKDGKRYVLADE